MNQFLKVRQRPDPGPRTPKVSSGDPNHPPEWKVVRLGWTGMRCPSCAYTRRAPYDGKDWGFEKTLDERFIGIWTPWDPGAPPHPLNREDRLESVCASDVYVKKSRW